MDLLRLPSAQSHPVRPKFAATTSYSGNGTVKIGFTSNYGNNAKADCHGPFTISAALSKSTPAVDKPVHPPPSSSQPAGLRSTGTAPSQPLLRLSPSSLQCEPGYLVPNHPVSDENGALGQGTLTAMEYLTKILSSKVYDVADVSPLQLATKLSQRLGVNVWLKREDLQPVRFFWFTFL